VINFDFPASYSGVYDGCIVYSTEDTSDDGGITMGTSSRKALPIQVQLQASKVSIHIIANL
jgi:hypothetical protein